MKTKTLYTFDMLVNGDLIAEGTRGALVGVDNSAPIGSRKATPASWAYGEQVDIADIMTARVRFAKLADLFDGVVVAKNRGRYRQFRANDGRLFEMFENVWVD